MGMYDEHDERSFSERQDSYEDRRSANEEQPKKKRGWIWILAGFGATILTAVAVLGAALAANGIYKAVRTDEQPTIVEEAEQPTQAPRNTPSQPGKQTPESEAAETQDGSKAVLTVSNPVQSTDDQVSVTVLDVSDIVDAVMPAVVAITDTLEYTSIKNSNPYSYFFGQGGGSSYEGVCIFGTRSGGMEGCSASDS